MPFRTYDIMNLFKKYPLNFDGSSIFSYPNTRLNGHFSNGVHHGSDINCLWTAIEQVLQPMQNQMSEDSSASRMNPSLNKRIIPLGR